MQILKSTWIVIASCLALIALILFQVNWLKHSKNLIEEQFDQKVTMALCSAVEQLGKEGEPYSIALSNNCLTPTQSCTFPTCKPNNVDPEALYGILDRTLKRYNIHLDFDFDVVSNQELNPLQAAYCSSIDPLTQNEKIVQLHLEGREQYVIQKMGFMIGSSILILLVVSFLFLLTLFKLFHQKRLYHTSIDFFNNTAHEFRTPLTNIKLASNMLKKRAGEHAFINVIQGEAARLMEQVERLLHIAKLEDGNYQLEYQLIEIEPFLKEVVKEMQMQVQEHQGQILIHLMASSTLKIKGDVLHLHNAIRNILENALKYCREYPQIDIYAKQIDRQILFSFTDNGIGMCDQTKKNIFEKYQRGTLGNIHDYKGFGIGLSYVKKVVELHQGKIEVQSTAGKGSTFNIYLPAAG